MAIDIFKALAGVPSSVFTPAKAKASTPLEQLTQLTAGAGPVSNIYEWPGQKQPYAPVGTTQTQEQTFSAVSDPAERAYIEEKNRVAQLAAQNPELQRYEIARKTAAKKDATPEQVQSAEDIGMQLWAKANPELAKRVKPGQSGYDVIQGVINTGAMGTPAELPFNPASLLGTNTAQSVPSYAGASDLQPIGTPLPQTQFNTPQNQFQAQMFNRFMSGENQPSVAPPPVNPAETTYASATGVQPEGGISLEPFSFNTPAEKRRSELFQQLLNSRLATK